jgi:hypothetical protein
MRTILVQQKSAQLLQKSEPHTENTMLHLLLSGADVRPQVNNTVAAG